MQFADAAVQDQLGGLAELRHGALLRAELEDAPVLAAGGPQDLILDDAQAERFLDVDVLAVAHGRQRHGTCQ